MIPIVCEIRLGARREMVEVRGVRRRAEGPPAFWRMPGVRERCGRPDAKSRKSPVGAHGCAPPVEVGSRRSEVGKAVVGSQFSVISKNQDGCGKCFDELLSDEPGTGF